MSDDWASIPGTNVRVPIRGTGNQSTSCTWHGDEEGCYETACGHIFQVIDGTPTENAFGYCCFCGKPLNQILWDGGEE